MVFAERIKQPANPRASAGLLSRLTFWWLRGLLWRGYSKGDLDLEDVPEVLDDSKSEVLGRELERRWKERSRTQVKPSLLWVLVRTYLPRYAHTAMYPILGEIVGKIALTFALSWLIATFRSAGGTPRVGSQDEKWWWWREYRAHLCGLGYLLASFLAGAAHHALFHASWLAGMRLRLALTSLIYRKTLRLTSSSLNDKASIGQITNLMTNDAMRFDEAFLFVHYSWSSVAQFAIVMSLVWHQVGPAPSLSVAGFMLTLVIVQRVVSSKFAKLRSATAQKTDVRLKTTTEIVTNMKMIKVYAWEKSFERLVGKQRREEMGFVWKTLVMRAVTDICQVIGTKGMHLAFLVPFILVSGRGSEPMVPEDVYLALALLSITRQGLTECLPLFFIVLMQCLVSVKRIQTFLEIQEVEETPTPIADGPVGICLSHVCARWPNSAAGNGLNDVNLDVRQGQLIVVTGSVGSGKTSLLQVILGEVPISSGRITVTGNVSYVPQEPWLFSGTVKENILFGSDQVTDHYDNIIRLCALDKDMAAWSHGDLSFVGERGLILSGGQKARIALARALYCDSDIYLFDDPFATLDPQVGGHILEKCLKDHLKNKCVLLITHNLSCARVADQLFILENGCLCPGTIQELTKQQRNRHRSNNQPSSRKDHADSKGSHQTTLKTESKKEGLVSLKTYCDYFKMSHSPCLTVLLLVSLVLAPLIYTMADMFVGFWANIAEGTAMPYLSPGHYLGMSPNHFYLFVFSSIILALTFVTTAQVILQFVICVNSSQNLHNVMMSKCLQSPLAFFTDNPFGQVMNRFSKDLGVVDEMLPHTIVEVEFLISKVASTIIIASYYVPMTLPPIILLAVVCFILRRFYVLSSSPVRRMEAITKSPLLSQLGSTIDGISTIRACKTEEILRREFDQQQDVHSSTSYMFHSLARWFGLSMDVCVLLYQAAILISLLFLDTSGALKAGDVGVILLSAFDMTRSLQSGMRMTALLDMAMTSMERSLEMTRLTSEASHEDQNQKRALEKWPHSGTIEFKHIGIVGRTGAGKSSLIAALFRLTEPEGKILIDGVDIAEIGLHWLRKNISIIPQDPLVMHGTLRRNLDPFDLYADDQLWQALNDAHLDHLAKASSQGLNAEILEGGSNLSAGEKQLLCLARAILPGNKILVMDEATANVDTRTDMLIQKTVKAKFGNCTVLTIAHRLRTVIAADRILVMSAGQILEYDHPHTLLEDPDSALNQLVSHERPEVREDLKRQAKETFSSRLD